MIKRLVLLAGLGVQAIVAQELSEPLPEKDLTTPHLDSRLARITHGAAKAASKKSPSLEITADGRLVVVVEPPPGLESSDIDVLALEALGARVTDRSKHLLQIEIPSTGLLPAGSVEGVHFIRPPIRPVSQAVVSQGVALFGADDYHANALTGAGG